MPDASRDIERLEHAFWKSLVERDADAVTALLVPQALMVSSNGLLRFDPAQYVQMLEDPKHGLLDYKLLNMDVMFPSEDVAIATYEANQTMAVDGGELTQDVFDSSTWVRMGGTWKCVAHTESEAPATP
jgi:ketosteroid isomerase-like protein